MLGFQDLQGEGSCPVVALVFKTSLGIVRYPEGSTPSLLRQSIRVRSQRAGLSAEGSLSAEGGVLSETAVFWSCFSAAPSAEALNSLKPPQPNSPIASPVRASYRSISMYLSGCPAK